MWAQWLNRHAGAHPFSTNTELQDGLPAVDSKGSSRRWVSISDRCQLSYFSKLIKTDLQNYAWAPGYHVAPETIPGTTVAASPLHQADAAPANNREA